MSWVAAGGAPAALLLIALLGWRARWRRPGRIDTPEDAMREAGAVLSGFDAVSAVVAANGAAALVIGRGGRVAVLQLGRRHIRVREISWSAMRATYAGVVIEADARFAPVSLAGVDALHVRRLMGAA